MGQALGLVFQPLSANAAAAVDSVPVGGWLVYRIVHNILQEGLPKSVIIVNCKTRQRDM